MLIRQAVDLLKRARNKGLCCFSCTSQQIISSMTVTFENVSEKQPKGAPLQMVKCQINSR